MIGIDDFDLQKVARLGIEMAIEVNQAVDFRCVCLGAGNGAFFINLVDQHLDDAIDLGRQLVGGDISSGNSSASSLALAPSTGE